MCEWKEKSENNGSHSIFNLRPLAGSQLKHISPGESKTLVWKRKRRDSELWRKNSFLITLNLLGTHFAANVSTMCSALGGGEKGREKKALPEIIRSVG